MIELNNCLSVCASFDPHEAILGTGTHILPIMIVSGKVGLVRLGGTKLWI